MAPGGDLAGALVILSLCVIEVGGGAYQFKTKMKKRREYEEFISFVKKREAPATLVVGDSGLGFDLGFDGPLVDKGYALLTASLGHAKFRLGCVGDRPADLILLDYLYRGDLLFAGHHRPALLAEIRRELQAHFRLVYQSELYQVYSARKGARETECGKSG